ncbi:diguanylate cyclase domain-containing protein [Vibrio proteolyticus]|uniref:GGDEF domain-containing protein n=1 Tax=Vibrio proteolyticus NBRC 13287 TaxID=1219065 RepID=U2ZGE1_VIBPR|nr:diguanylate cyclase [Vibrio proteolyticus]GAD66746.1 hypothetical protein VPR01S_05_00410 [Vibrio proteolyticus NBRC 13287]
MIDTQQCLTHPQLHADNISDWQHIVDLVARLSHTSNAAIIRSDHNGHNVMLAASHSEYFIPQQAVVGSAMHDLVHRTLDVNAPLCAETAELPFKWFIAQSITFSGGKSFGILCVALQEAPASEAETTALVAQFARSLGKDLTITDQIQGSLALNVKDTQTDVLNRGGFTLLAEQKIKDAPRTQLSIGVLSIDISRIDEVISAYGADKAQQCVETLAEVMHKVCREADIIGRLHDHSFAIVSLLNTRRELNQLAQRVHKDYLDMVTGTEDISLSDLTIGMHITDCFSKPTLDELLETARNDSA